MRSEQYARLGSRVRQKACNHGIRCGADVVERRRRCLCGDRMTGDCERAADHCSSSSAMRGRGMAAAAGLMMPDSRAGF